MAGTVSGAVGPTDRTGLTLTVLGCSGSFAGPGMACSGYLVRSATTCLWLDAGPGTLANLQRHVGLADVDAIVLSHEHPDHWTDVQGFAVASEHVYHLDPVPVLVPAGLSDRAQGPVHKLAWDVVGDGDERPVGDLLLRFSRTDHGPETLAVRVEGGGRALGYSADSGPGWSLEALGAGLDLALCEATYLSSQEGGGRHMTARQAGETARRAGVGRLVITHLQPTVDPGLACIEASAAFGAPVVAAAADMVSAV